MLIKAADDRAGDIDVLQRLLTSADAVTARRIEQEIRQIKAGVRGEQDAAYEMQVRWGHRGGWMILHDLRIEHEGLVAQIDHLIINRLFDFWVCESKHFSEGVSINEHGEFTAFFGGKPYGVPSPIAQNARHIAILQRFLTSGGVKLPTRLGLTIKPTLRSLVLVSKGARISRPTVSVPGLESVIKVDQMFQSIDKAIDEANPLLIAKVVSEQTVLNLATEIAACHRPASFDWSAKFGLAARPKQAPTTEPLQRPSKPEVDVADQTQDAGPTGASSDQVERQASSKPGKQYLCTACATSVELKVARFCWFNKPKFGGNIYCMDCQKTVLDQAKS